LLTHFFKSLYFEWPLAGTYLVIVELLEVADRRNMDDDAFDGDALPGVKGVRAFLV
jgi:hypothetical protein